MVGVSRLRHRVSIGVLSCGLACASFCAAASAQTAEFPSGTGVGQQSAALTVTVNVTQSGSAVAPAITSQGAAKPDFVLAPGGTCAAGSYTAGTQCTVSVIFEPQFPGLRLGAVSLTTSSGILLGQAQLSGVATGGLAVLKPGIVNTIAGNGQWIYGGDGMVATSAALFLPNGIAEDASGNLYISDSSNNRIRRVDATTGLISTVAGNGVPGYSGDHLQATDAEISSPSALVLDGADNVYFVDSGNMIVRRVDALTGVITTVAGLPGMQGYSGDGGPATAAKLSLPEGLAIDPAGDLFIADTGNNVIRRVASGIITTVAGNGQFGYNGDNMAATKAFLSSPWGIALGLDGSLYIADLSNNRVRKVDPSGTITTVAGNGYPQFTGDGAQATNAQLDAPATVAVDPGGNLYIGDSANNRVREVLASTGNIQTIVGNGNTSFDGDGGTATTSSLYGPYALYIDQKGNLLVADMFHNRIREVSATTLPIAFSPIRVSKVSAPVAEGLENDGNATLNIQDLALNNAALDVLSTTCATGPMSAATACNMGIEFAPTVVGNPVLGSVTVQSDAANSPNVVSLSGEVLSVNPTTVALTSSANPSQYATAVTFTATVSSSDTTLGGTVTFLDGTTPLCTAVPLSGFSAQCTSTALALGQHSITASYTGDSDNAASVSPTLLQIVRQMPTVGLTASPNPAIITQTVTLNATITAPTGTPTGTVSFFDNGTALQTVNVNNGVASITTAQLSAGSHKLTASYSGDTNDAPAQSAAVSETVNLATSLTVLGTSSNTVTVGSAVTFTATVTSVDGPAATGSVSFLDGTTVLGTGTLNGGIATLTTVALAPGNHSITATYSGDSDNATSTSTALSEAVEQLQTAIALTSSANPSNAGASVQFTATVTATGGGVPLPNVRPAASPIVSLTGTVTFTDGAVTLGTAPLNASGVATLTASAMTAGTHNIVASYSGNTDYGSSTSATLKQVVNQTTSITVLSASGSGLAGQALHLSAAVSSTTGVPTGTVTFLDGTVTLGQGTLNAQGVATLTVSTLAVGNHSLSASYAGDTNYNSSVSAPVGQAIALAVPSLTLAGPTSVVNAGTAAVFTAGLASSGVAPTGTMTLRDGSTVIATQAVSGTGNLAFNISTLAVGIHTITVAYSGDADNASATSNAVSVTVQQGSTTTALATSVNPQTLGQALTLSAQVSSPSPNVTGTVSFYDGTTLLSSVAVGSNGTASYTTSTLTFGPHTLTAAYSGDSNHAASTSPAVSQHIVEPVQIGLTSSANPAVAGASVTFTATLAGNATTLPTGTVKFLDGATLIGTGTLTAGGMATFTTTSLAVGAHTISAAYAGDTNYAAGASSVLTESVVNANTQVALTASANPATYGSPLTLSAVVTSNGGVASGKVSFTDGGTTVGSGVLDATGTATVTLSTLAPGMHSIVANYAGNGSESASVSSALSLSVRQTTQVTLASSANPSPTLSPVTFTATITNAGQDVASGTVTFTDGSSQLGTATVNASGMASLTLAQMSAAAHSIVATYAGDTNNFSGASAALTQTVQLRPTSTALTASTDPTNAQQVTLIAVVRWTGPNTPTGTVTFTGNNNTVSSAAVDGTGVATVTVDMDSTSENFVATYSGDSAYATSASPSTTIGTTATPQFTMSLDPPMLSMASKQHGATTLAIASTSTFTDTVTFGCLGLPYAATCTFSNTQAQLKAGGSASVQVTVDTGNPLGAGGSEDASNQTRSNVLVCFLPGTLLAGVLLWRSRRRAKLMALLAMVCAVALMFTTTGCGGLNVNGTPAGKYTFQVTARGVNTGVSESQTMTLNVGQ